jgi:hypothetical protein
VHPSEGFERPPSIWDGRLTFLASAQSLTALSLILRFQCTAYFQAYKDCKELWMSNQRAVKRGGQPAPASTAAAARPSA